MINAVVGKLLKMVGNLKLVKAEIEESELKKFIATCDAASSLGEYMTTLNGYSLKEYQMADALSGVVLPRIVKLKAQYGMCNLLNTSVFLDGDIMSPSEFKEFQHKLYNMFKKVPTFTSDLEQLTQPVLVTDVLNCIQVKGGVLVEGTPSTRPVKLTFDFCNDGIGEMSEGEFVSEFVYSIVAKLR